VEHAAANRVVKSDIVLIDVEHAAPLSHQYMQMEIVVESDIVLIDVEYAAALVLSLFFGIFGITQIYRSVTQCN